MSATQSTNSENSNQDSPKPQLVKPKHRRMAKGLRSNFLDYLEKQIAEQERLLDLNLRERSSTHNPDALKEIMETQGKKFQADLETLQNLLQEQREALIHETVEAMEAKKAAAQSSATEASADSSTPPTIPVHHRNRTYHQLPSSHVYSSTVRLSHPRMNSAPTLVSRVASAYCSRFTAGVANPVLRPLDNLLGRLSSFFFGTAERRAEAGYKAECENKYPFLCCTDLTGRDSVSIPDPERVTFNNQEYFVHRALNIRKNDDETHDYVIV
mmetsp:Transcript_13382/g.30813  ORF Transcript_13382/g.30813 Transcript_13382/m.30813 type:complete len:270 (-) Transcript_13382:145-954(-)